MTIQFKTEHSLWQMMRDGTKRWDARTFSMGDERYYEMSQGSQLPDGRWKSDVDQVSFIDKETDEVLTLELRDLMFVPWAPGWVFMTLASAADDLPW